MRKHNHYFKSVAHLQDVDVYRVLDLFQVTDQALGHAIKKLLVAGGRGVKDQRKDISEAIDTLQRKLEMMDEDVAVIPLPAGHVPCKCEKFCQANTANSWVTCQGKPRSVLNGS